MSPLKIHLFLGFHNSSTTDIHTTPNLINTIIDSTHLEANKMFFRLPMTCRCQLRPVIALKLHKASKSTRTKKMRHIFLFLPTHTTNIIGRTNTPSHQICFRRYFVFQNLPCCEMRWWLCLYPPETLKQISLVCLNIFLKNVACRFDRVNGHKSCIICCSRFFSQSNKFLLHSIF